jgi:hypothetical protein
LGVEQRAPLGVVVEDRVGKADQAVILGEDRAAARVLRSEPAGPDRQPVRDHVAIEELVGVGAAVVAAPAVGVQLRDGRGVGGPGAAEVRHLSAA